MDIAYKIRVIDRENTLMFDLGDVSHEVNMLLCCLELSHLQPTISLSHILTTEERNLLVVDNGDAEVIESIQTKATVMKSILKKLATEIYKIETYNFANYLESIKTRIYDHNITIEAIDEKAKMLKGFASFHNDLGRIEIVVDFACEQDADIQFIVNYY